MAAGRNTRAGRIAAVLKDIERISAELEAASAELELAAEQQKRKQSAVSTATASHPAQPALP